VLQRAGADVDAPFIGAHGETALHWAASNDDVALVDALIDAGAEIEAPGSVIDGGAPLADAIAFGQWQAAERLLERGARATFFQAAAMGLSGQVATALSSSPSRDDLNAALWGACHGGRRETAELLLDSGAEIEWRGWDDLTPLAAAERAGADDLVAWLRGRGLPHVQ
jgi:ankyrin repeat protein